MKSLDEGPSVSRIGRLERGDIDGNKTVTATLVPTYLVHRPCGSWSSVVAKLSRQSWFQALSSIRNRDCFKPSIQGGGRASRMEGSHLEPPD